MLLNVHMKRSMLVTNVHMKSSILISLQLRPPTVEMGVTSCLYAVQIKGG